MGPPSLYYPRRRHPPGAAPPPARGGPRISGPSYLRIASRVSALIEAKKPGLLRMRRRASAREGAGTLSGTKPPRRPPIREGLWRRGLAVGRSVSLIVISLARNIQAGRPSTQPGISAFCSTPAASGQDFATGAFGLPARARSFELPRPQAKSRARAPARTAVRDAARRTSARSFAASRRRGVARRGRGRGRRGLDPTISRSGGRLHGAEASEGEPASSIHPLPTRAVPSMSRARPRAPRRRCRRDEGCRRSPVPTWRPLATRRTPPHELRRAGPVPLDSRTRTKISTRSQVPGYLPAPEDEAEITLCQHRP